jgi:hypothetical protein
MDGRILIKAVPISPLHPINPENPGLCMEKVL